MKNDEENEDHQDIVQPTTNTSSDENTRNESNVEPGQQLEPFEGEKENSSKRSYGNRLISANEPKSKSTRLIRHLGILGLLTFTSIWGLLAREGLIALNTYDGSSIEPTIWAQSIGCLIMGWSIENKTALEEFYPPIYIALTTGLCGSITTFSSWILHVFQAYGNQLHYKRHGLHNVMDALTQTSATIGMSLISLYAGKAIAKILPIRKLLYHFESFTVQKRFKKEEILDSNFKAPYTILPDISSAFIGIIFWIASAILCGTYPPFRRVTFSIILSPPGAILRWYLSRLNSSNKSKKFPFWPIGTLLANLIATAILSAAFVGQHVGRQFGQQSLGVHTINACDALYGLQEGFCGCLSTISTFAVELNTIKPKRRAFGYAFGSYFIGISICILIIGSPWWSIGMDGSCNN